MRLLVVGHSYVTPFAQEKYVAMKSLCPDLDVRVVVPHVVRHMFAEHRPILATGLAPRDLVVIRSLAGGSNMTRMLEPVRLAGLIREFQPTHVHIEEDPHSIVGFEATCLASWLCPTAALSYFLWDNVNRPIAFPLGTFKRTLTRFGLSRARLIVCGNQEAKRLLAAKGYHGPSAVIPQLGLEAGDVCSEVRQTNRVPTIGYLGRLVEEKGLLDLLTALGLLRDIPWRLVIRGAGPLRTDIDQRWSHILGDRLLCLNPVPHAEVQNELSKIDIFVLPSFSTPRWQEQFGLTLVQAMFAGCACIGSSSGAIPEVLDGTGVIYRERDVAGLAEALRRCLSSGVERIRMGTAARTLALSRYTHQAIAQRYLAAFNSAAR